MRAAVIHRFGDVPRCEDVPAPTPGRPEEVVVDVVAAGLHPRVRSQAAGSHYASTDTLPLVPGIDGVGRDSFGVLRYFVLPDTALGSMAEQTLVDVRRSVVLPPAADPVRLAAAMNPAMSSWLALRRRIGFERGGRVLVLGATGNAGQLAVQVARHLGASHVTAAGRDRQRLEVLSAVGADRLVVLPGGPGADLAELAEAGRDVDVVLDYLWGAPTAEALRAVVPARSDDGRRLSWVQIGSVAGLECPVPSAALRATRLEIVGSGQGSVPVRDILEELPTLAAAIDAGTFTVDARAVPLADVDSAWGASTLHDRRRVVITP